MSPVLDTLSTILSDLDLVSSSGRYDAATGFKKTQAGFYDCFDKLMAASKSLIAAYHSMLEMHKDCARMINQLLALGQPNSVVVQHIRARKAQIEQDMLEMESIQCETMRSIQLLHDGNQLVIRILRRLKQPEEENQKGCKRKADEMDGESDSGSSEAE
ncbi:hypothetical protein HO133_005853 [Letharia lupina]|uniref:Uncharacterized protein n=1 Tax=Letharia lupina TaxID=560253 RepID=A0A8H6C7Y0_9LECA|nr:uncharacterized protein HO133_005853 [Letharia lupina]KAF6218504.1 hypothetical protein HO133_005853 [Letharia lupina]